MMKLQTHLRKLRNSIKKAPARVGVILLVLVIAIAGAGVVWFQDILKLSQDLRQQAAGGSGRVVITTDDNNDGALRVNQQNTIDLRVDSNNVQTDGIQVVFNFLTSTVTQPPTVTLDSTVGLQEAYKEIVPISGGYKISLIALPTTIGQPFTTQDTRKTFARVQFTPTSTGSISLQFDNNESLSTLHLSNPPVDELKTIAAVTYQVGNANPTNTPTPTATAQSTPTTTPTVKPATPTPTANPTVAPTATPRPATPTPTPNSGVGGITIKQCNESCSSNRECATNLYCYGGRCRSVTNPNSESCTAPPDQGIQRSCNEYCANNGECKSGLSCYYNRCRHPLNLESTSCSTNTSTGSTSTGGGTSGSTASTSIKYCNETCSSNSQCASNLSCYQGRCRLATNPTNSSCSAYASGSTTGSGGSTGTGTGSSGPKGSTTTGTNPGADSDYPVDEYIDDEYMYDDSSTTDSDVSDSTEVFDVGGSLDTMPTNEPTSYSPQPVATVDPGLTVYPTTRSPLQTFRDRLGAFFWPVVGGGGLIAAGIIGLIVRSLLAGGTAVVPHTPVKSAMYTPPSAGSASSAGSVGHAAARPPVNSSVTPVPPFAPQTSQTPPSALSTHPAAHHSSPAHAVQHPQPVAQPPKPAPAPTQTITSPPYPLHGPQTQATSTPPSPGQNMTEKLKMKGIQPPGSNN